MYLAQVKLLNFRNFMEFSIDLQPGLNIILGENNTGKTNLLDAIRIFLNSGEERRDIWASLQDLHHDDEGNVVGDTFEIHLTFRDLNTEEWGLFNPCRATIDGEDVAQIHFLYKRYTTAKGRDRGRPTMWGGETEGTEIPREAMEEVRVTFLPALRNAEADLRPGRNTRVSRLLAEVKETQAELDALVKEVQGANEVIQSLDLIKRAERIINENLLNIIGPVRPQSASFAMSEPEFREIADSIKVLVGSEKHFEVTENGLGYNNLLYVSTVLGELSRSAENEVSLPILMIEEPEAHLHPQLQMLLVDHLVNRVDSPVQVLLTSHSPTLASKVPVNRISVLHEGRTGEKAGKTAVKPIRDCGLDIDQQQDLSRYLDITKSTLFFSRGVILVEGISEALLLPVLAHRMGIDLAQHAVTVVNVSSLAFEPFAKLFQEGGLDIPCALITDADPRVEEKENLSEDEKNQIEYPEQLARISTVATRLQSLKSGQLQVFLACKTFEYDLALASDNNALVMTRVYKDMGHPEIGERIGESLIQCATLRRKARAFYQPSLEKYPREKARFAQRLAAYLDKNETSFVVPEYIQKAVSHAIGEGA
jgi:putative ATP-dependent endonuclease of OLD family